ncbi:glucuronyl esterase domain-containing protein [Pareuzebyella sediminis]|uniref:glucuronyl esterase domain-containing protein n=1 Tax=Pareuzebyella sediminis TaxID=2607998 RepID=UPI001E41A87D|nr:acetylxylan esterase [Pareuzebyella sediminis]
MNKLLPALTLAFVAQITLAQGQPNYDESEVPELELTDLLTFNGKKVSTPKDWNENRRPELYRFFEQHEYGQVPGVLDSISFNRVESDDKALNGTALRKQVVVSLFKNDKSLSFTILMYLPKNASAVPIFLGYNFYGNHTVTEDPNVIISKAWARNNKAFDISDNTLTENSRGVRTSRWSIQKMIDSGFGFATIYYGEIDPDKNDLTDGIHQLFYQQDQQHPKPNEWGSISAWAFGLSRALDYLETDKDIDASKVIAFGHSRLGKVSLWAAASDQRFAGAISNDSGCGGAALSKRKFGETVGRINTSFPHWFSDNFKKYNNKEEDLPVDQHGLLALIAPRPLYVASAEDDQWADPKGEFLSTYYATPVYDLFDKKGIPSDKMPEIHRPIHHTIGYHIRSGKHDVTDYDWSQYIAWAKAQIEK